MTACVHRVWKAAGFLLRRLFSRERKVIIMNEMTLKPFSARFIDADDRVHLELTNTTDEVLNVVEILAVFLKDQGTQGGGPSRAHIKFEALKSVAPKAKALVPHRTWIDGKPVGAGQDQLERLKVVAGEVKPYVLDISWENGEGRTRYQRIPVGH
jgi:hypothetical protein